MQNFFTCYETQQLILGTGTAIWWVTEPHYLSFLSLSLSLTHTHTHTHPHTHLHARTFCLRFKSVSQHALPLSFPSQFSLLKLKFVHALSFILSHTHIGMPALLRALQAFLIQPVSQLACLIIIFIVIFNGWKKSSITDSFFSEQQVLYHPIVKYKKGLVDTNKSNFFSLCTIFFWGCAVAGYEP